MKNNYLVSIIVPVYNTEKYLKKCLDSIINQTYSNIEIILIDDGSTDNSPKICDEYKSRNNNIKVIHQTNSGVSTARNVGLDAAIGEYVGFIDSDDYIDNNMVEKIMKEIIYDNLDIAICNLYIENENNIEMKELNYTDCFIERNRYPFEMYTNTSIEGFACNKIYKRSIIEKYGIRFKEGCVVLEDDLFNYQIFHHNKKLKIKYINDKFYHYVQLNTGARNSSFNLKKLSYLDVRNVEIDILSDENISADHLKADYINVYLRMKHLAQKNRTYSAKIFNNYKRKCDEYKKSIVLKNLTSKQKIKYSIINYLPFIYYLKLLINREK